MAWSLRPFASGLAQRIFGLFLVATLIPVGLFALIASDQVSNTLTARSYAALADSSRTFGQSVYLRLRTAEDFLLRQNAPLDDRRADGGFREVWVFDRLAEGDRVPETIRPHLTSQRTVGRTRVVVTQRRVFLLTPVDSNGLQRVGELRPEYLWGTTQALPYATDYCVSQAGNTLWCSWSDRPELGAIGEVAFADEMRWVQAGETWLGSRWDLFLSSGFEAEIWQVVAIQPAAVALESLNAFRRTFPYIFVLSLLAAAILASIQIRRTMNPLDVLMAGIRRFSERRFDHRIEVNDRGEFAMLAGAMNDMAGNLDAQFDALALLAEVDRKILDAEGIEWVLEEMLQKFRTLVGAQFAGVLLLDKNSEFSASLYSASAGNAPATNIRRLDISLGDYRWFNEHEHAAVVKTAEVAPALRGDMVQYGDCARVYSLRLGGKLAGSLCLVWQAAAEADSMISSVARDFADRLTVALAAVEREAELYRRGHFDPLTSLPNRELLNDRLGQALVQAKDRREHGDTSGVAVIFIDLDRFKDINDSMGHGAGDALLCEAGRRLQTVVSEAATVSRLGGDEFVIVLPRYDSQEELDGVSRAVLGVLAQPFEVEGVTTYISASLGVARSPEDGVTAGELLRKADTAMYEAKESGRGTGRFFSAAMEVEVQYRANLQRELHRALQEEEFHLEYQPQLRLKDGSLAGVETLVRWQHPNRGLVAPSEFVSLAEDVGLIQALDDWVLRSAVEQTRRWLDDGFLLDCVAINVSAQHFNKGFAAQVEELLQATGVPPEIIGFEITESAFAKDVGEVAAAMVDLRALGVGIAIDDFGTGYASMSYIQDLEFDAIKIDQSFVRSLPSDRQAVAIAHAIVAMGRSLDKVVVAEGVETEAQRRCLQEMGCTVGQGYLFAKPLRPDDLLTWKRDYFARKVS